MGKHERKRVFIAENIINHLLNEEKITEKDKNHEFFKYAKILAERIKSDFPNIKESQHIGNIYDTSIGNLKLTLDTGKEVFLELKFLSRGTGTRANIGQDSLTDFRLFKGRPVPWSRFRKNKNHTEWVKRELKKYKNYPREIEDIGERKMKIYEKAGHLKKILNVGGKNTLTIVENVLSNPTSSSEERKIAKIIKRIMEKDREEKLKYLNYLKDFDQNYKNIKKFLFLILTGSHTHKDLKNKWSRGLLEILETLKNEYYVYYLYKDTLNTDREEHYSKLKNLINKKIFVSFPKNETNVLLSFKHKGEEMPILRVVFHWKNKFQGIQTPCLNIFDDKYLTSSVGQLGITSLTQFQKFECFQ